jgi:hypothetical protein
MIDFIDCTLVKYDEVFDISSDTMTLKLYWSNGLMTIIPMKTGMITVMKSEGN